jgi:hypothetical protein
MTGTHQNPVDFNRSAIDGHIHKATGSVQVQRSAQKAIRVVTTLHQFH